MRCSSRFRPQTEKENIDATERLQLLQVALQLAFQIIRVGLHRGKALDLGEERTTQESLEIANEAQTVVHSQRRQCILRKDVKTIQQIIDFVCLSKTAKNAIQSLCATATQQNDDEFAVFFISSLFDLLELSPAHRFFRIHHFVNELARLSSGERERRRSQPNVL